MMTRRQSLHALAALPGAMALATTAQSAAADGWRMPDEAEPHARTWMAFGAQPDIWGKKLLPVVQQNLADIALAIARFEPVSMLVRSGDMATARRLMGNRVELVEQAVDDFWMRDTGPVFVTSAEGKKAGVDFNFNGWGKKQKHAQDARSPRSSPPVQTSRA